MKNKEAAVPPITKIGQLVDVARAALHRVGIETEGKRSDEILRMAREERNKLREYSGTAEGNDHGDNTAR